MRPGVCEVRASALRPVSALIRLDLPTLERPANATSTPAIGGSVSIEGEAQKNSPVAGEQLSPLLDQVGIGVGAHAKDFHCSGDCAAITVIASEAKQSIRDAGRLDCFVASLLRNDEENAPQMTRQVFNSAFFATNVALRLSNSSTFTPLRRMMKLCCSTDSVLFQAQ